MENQRRYYKYNQPRSLKMSQNNDTVQDFDFSKALSKLNYETMPNNETLRNSLNQSQTQKKQRIIDEFIDKFSNRQQPIEGMINVKSSKTKQDHVKSDDTKPIKDYLQNFSSTTAVFSFNQAKEGSTYKTLQEGVKFKVDLNFIKQKIKKALQKNMQNSQQKRIGKKKWLQSQKFPRRKSIFETTLVRSIFDKNDKLLPSTDNYLQRAALQIQTQLHYNKRFKQRHIEDNFEKKSLIQTQAECDPRIQLMKRCIENFDGILPIFDKICRKTLCLQNYLLNEGHVMGIAEACKFLDHRVINRMLFNNVGISGDQLAKILQGVAQMHDFKALTYKQGIINKRAIESLVPLMTRPVPNHLEQIQIIDCKVPPTLIEQLLDELLCNSRVKKLALVNLQHSEKSFEKLAIVVKQSIYLRELDISWSNVRPPLMLKLLKELSENSTLESLSLAYNQLLEEQPINLLLEQERAGLTEVPLSDFNLEVVSQFKDFIKYNTSLVHLDLTMTGLIEPAIKYIVALLRRAQALSCLHLSGNKGLSEEIFEWIRNRICARQSEIPFHVPTCQAIYDLHEDLQSPPMNPNTARAEYPNERTKLQKDHQTELPRKAVREGIKLRSILNSVKIQAVNHTLGNFDSMKLLIQRKLGLKELIPRSGQWGVYTHAKDECWYCNQSILTIFLWNPRLGILNQIKSRQIKDHYQQAIGKNVSKMPQFDQPSFIEENPYIFGQFTGWRPQKMRNIVDFIIKYDPNIPDFQQLTADDGNIREICLGPGATEPLNQKELAAIEQKKIWYYQNHWAKIILPLFKYRYPFIANIENIPFLDIELSQDNPLYFHVDYVKPGRTIYVCQQEDKAKKKARADRLLFARDTVEFNEELMKQKSYPKTHVHQTFTPYRREPVYFHANPRHFSVVRKNNIVYKNMFKLWIEDTPESLNKALKADFNAKIKTFLSEMAEGSRINKLFLEFMPKYLDIFRYLQTNSKYYPRVDTRSIYQDLFTKLPRFNLGSYNQEAIQSILKETCVQNETLKQSEKYVKGSYLMNRTMFMEGLVRIACYYYADKRVLDQRMYTAKEKKEYKSVSEKHFDEVSNWRSLFLLIESCLKPFHDDQNFRGQCFRDEELWQKSVNTVLSTNEIGLRKLFTKYAKMVARKSYLSMQGCERMLIEDAQMQVSYELVRHAYVMSKMTVVNEHEEEENVKYTQMSFEEFCEFLARVVTIHFKDSELDELPLSEKLELILESVLPLVGHKFTRNITHIETFSDSDDDY